MRDLSCDYDMSNAHPTICLYLCQKHFPGQDWWKPIRKYIENRETLWNQLTEADIPASVAQRRRETRISGLPP